MRVSASIVLYHNDPTDLERAIRCIFASYDDMVLYLIDNSKNDNLRYLAQLHSDIIYIFNNGNPGFGRAHNIAIDLAIQDGSAYHFVLNPDVYFTEDVIPKMIRYAEETPTVGMVMPQILNDDGSEQHLPKLLPTPFGMLMRKVKWPLRAYEKFIHRYELRGVDPGLVYDVPILSGCFTLFRISVIKELGAYDDRFFMYFEDWDLSRRIHQRYQTIYFPLVSVVHGYESGANKNGVLFRAFVRSAIQYFNKWGWFFDKERKQINKKTLSQFD